MAVQVVTTGGDPLTAPVLAYLHQLGIPDRLITRVVLDSMVGQPQEVTVTLLVDPDLVQVTGVQVTGGAG